MLILEKRMPNQKILIVDNSVIFREFVKEKFSSLDIEVIIALNPLDALIKLKNNIPDLLIIDYQMINGKDSTFLEEKYNYKTIKDIPIILTAHKIDSTTVKTLAKYKVIKIFSKPVNTNSFLQTIGAVLKKPIELDETPAVLEVHLNEDILFIEAGMGLNSEKNASLKYKIYELKSLHKMQKFKVLLMLNDITSGNNFSSKLFGLIDNILSSAHIPEKALVVLSNEKEINELIHSKKEFKNISITNSIEHAMQQLGQIDISKLVDQDTKVEETDFAFTENSPALIDKKIAISIIDDDEYILDLLSSILEDISQNITTFTDGADFIKSIETTQPDLIMLDLMMPKMSGFEVLAQLKENNNNIPVIIFSALSSIETVKKTLQYGVKSYLVKPVDPDKLLNKAREILKSYF